MKNIIPIFRLKKDLLLFMFSGSSIQKSLNMYGYGSLISNYMFDIYEFSIIKLKLVFAITVFFVVSLG